MAKKRGLSADEKRQKMLAAMLEGKTVYNMKELEKVAKEQGISTMIVKDVVQEMLDDDMMIQEKVGTQTLYWIFPSQSYVLKQRKLEALRVSVSAAKEEKSQVELEVGKAKEAKPDSENRLELLRQHEELKLKRDRLITELESLKERDPETIKKMKIDVQMAVEGTNRWTDNIWSMKSYMVRQLGCSSKDADQNLGIPEDFDYIELPLFLRS